MISQNVSLDQSVVDTDGCTILVTGGTGKTGRRIAAALLRMGQRVRIASRNAEAENATKFAWGDPSSFDGAADGVSSAYLLAPTGVFDLLPAMRPFIDRLIAANVGRLVLLSASSLASGGPMMGAVHAYLADHAPRWTVLRPSWFMENFSEQQHLATIRNEAAIYSATGDGRVGFVSADDIAAVAAQLLVDAEIANGELILTGPEPLSYDEVAEKISNVVGKRVRHHALTVAKLAERYRDQGLPADYANTLANMDAVLASGAENRTTDAVARMVGRPPTSFDAFALGAVAAWL